ncbi:MAG: sigma-70 family RNA polymerase sigma factor [Pirellulaceae bacterium]|nr:sigma-70 family RNA polymerase sigma factor [Pirellulaceae bacterium]
MDQNELTIAQQWQRVVRGDAHEFAAIVDQYKNLLTSIAYSSIGDFSASEDIAQETFFVAWQSRNELRDPGKLPSWLSAIARNLTKQWVRKRSSKSWASVEADLTSVTQDAPHPSEQLVSDEEMQLVWSALEAIPETCREVPSCTIGNLSQLLTWHWL